jgi:hypothetical protein
MFQCNDSTKAVVQCILPSQVCDGIAHCTNKSDELNCSKCSLLVSVGENRPVCRCDLQYSSARWLAAILEYKLSAITPDLTYFSRSQRSKLKCHHWHISLLFMNLGSLHFYHIPTCSESDFKYCRQMIPWKT